MREALLFPGFVSWDEKQQPQISAALGGNVGAGADVELGRDAVSGEPICVLHKAAAGAGKWAPPDGFTCVLSLS